MSFAYARIIWAHTKFRTVCVLGNLLVKNNFGNDGQKIFEADKFVLLNQTVNVTQEG